MLGRLTVLIYRCKVSSGQASIPEAYSDPELRESCAEFLWRFVKAMERSEESRSWCAASSSKRMVSFRKLELKLCRSTTTSWRNEDNGEQEPILRRHTKQTTNPSLRHDTVRFYQVVSSFLNTRQGSDPRLVVFQNGLGWTYRWPAVRTLEKIGEDDWIRFHSKDSNMLFPSVPEVMYAEAELHVFVDASPTAYGWATDQDGIAMHTACGQGLPNLCLFLGWNYKLESSERGYWSSFKMATPYRQRKEFSGLIL